MDLKRQMENYGNNVLTWFYFGKGELDAGKSI